jgi:hypothetical protein
MAAKPVLTSTFVVPSCPLVSPGSAKLRPQRGPPRLWTALSDYAALLIGSRTCVRYPGLGGTGHDPNLGRPIAAPLERCAQLLGADLATVRELAAKVEPYVRADGTRWPVFSDGL